MRQASEVVDLADHAAAVVAGGSARAAAFARLADEHIDRSYHLARAILGDATEAQDAAHDAFVQAWRKWETLRDPGRFEQWFDRILVNACRDRLRARRSQATDISVEVGLATGDHAAHTDDQTALDAAIATLSPDHQIVVGLRYYRDLTIGDIASRLGIPPGTVQSRLHYALRRLHAALDAGAHERTAR